ncbi:MAG TPA: glycosyltransferase family 4 protein [Bryobacteraceae bacterium]|nr:glycosyltransferase family 4 protein [Bryobacteraceae bacterium]
MRYTVLSAAYPLAQVGPDAVGGAEQILTALDRALVKAGHNSLVIAAEGSQVAGTFIASPKSGGKLDDAARLEAQRAHAQLIRRALARFRVDLLHMHGLDFHRYLPEADVPVLATIHLPPDFYPRSIFSGRRRRLYLNSVSSSQRKACPRRAPSIDNGVEVSQFEWQSGERPYAFALGRICPEKGFHFALDAARLADVDLLLAGEVFPYAWHQEYFAREIVPRLDSRRRFIGPVGFREKKRLLARARCLLVPSTVAETSSLVAMEALASGTPVIAFPSGALAEIVGHGRTGYLVSNTAEMAQAISASGAIDPRACRRAAEVRFSAAAMFEGYIALYRRILLKEARFLEVQTLARNTRLRTASNEREGRRRRF